ncbi:ATP-grasp fold amidoligase family protein [Sphingopyxis sp.]|uniref:ATP-grasp fold amidoligase family protein n=1 Tax=Sphingopyxis sp. TaxID=1908224 RepID=UPI003BAA5837
MSELPAPGIFAAPITASPAPGLRSGTDSAGLLVSQARIAISYAWRHGRWPNLAAAPRFTEMVQMRKLFDRSVRQTMLMDKVAAKRIAGSALGPEWIVPTLWLGTALPASLPFALPAMLKARHGCNQYRPICSVPGPAELARLRRTARRWQRAPYGGWLDEWAYREVPRGLLAEPLLGGALPLPIDYKIYVFGGVATHVQVHLDRGGRHRWVLHDRDWRPLVEGPDRPARPASLAAMLNAAEVLGRGFAFVRTDFYEVGGRPYFGEYCLYPGSGFDPFAADWIDLELGSLWHAALAGGMGCSPSSTAPMM